MHIYHRKSIITPKFRSHNSTIPQAMTALSFNFVRYKTRALLPTVRYGPKRSPGRRCPPFSQPPFFSAHGSTARRVPLRGHSFCGLSTSDNYGLFFSFTSCQPLRVIKEALRLLIKLPACLARIEHVRFVEKRKMSGSNLDRNGLAG